MKVLEVLRGMRALNRCQASSDAERRIASADDSAQIHRYTTQTPPPSTSDVQEAHGAAIPFVEQTQLL
jgi:hypothetical protein